MLWPLYTHISCGLRVALFKQPIHFTKNYNREGYLTTHYTFTYICTTCICIQWHKIALHNNGEYTTYHAHITAGKYIDRAVNCSSLGHQSARRVFFLHSEPTQSHIHLLSHPTDWRQGLCCIEVGHVGFHSKYFPSPPKLYIPNTNVNPVCEYCIKPTKWLIYTRSS